MTFLAALFVACIFAAPVCFIANDLSVKIVAQRKMLLQAKASALESAEKFRSLRDTQTTEKSKVTMLRDRAKTIVKEILTMQGKQNTMGKDLIKATTALDALRINHTRKVRHLTSQLNITMHALKNHVVGSRQLESLLAKNLEERVRVENSLAYVQNATLDLAHRLNTTKRQLGTKIRMQKVMNEQLRQELNETKRSLEEARRGVTTASAEAQKRHADEIEALHAKWDAERQSDAGSDERLREVERKLAEANEKLRSIQNDHDAQVTQLRQQWKKQFDDAELEWKTKLRGADSQLELHKAQDDDDALRDMDELRKKYAELEQKCNVEHQSLVSEMERKVFEVENTWKEKHGELELRHAEAIGAVKSEHAEKHTALEDEWKKKHRAVSLECDKVRAEEERQFEAKLSRCEFHAQTLEREKKELLVEIGEKKALGEHAGGQAQEFQRKSEHLEAELKVTRAELDETRRKLDSNLAASKKDQNSYLDEIRALRADVASSQKKATNVQHLADECTAKLSSLQAQRAVELGSKLNALRSGMGAAGSASSNAGLAGASQAYQFNTDRPGYDLSTMASPNARKCRSGCLANSKCQAWSFNKETLMCALKHSVPDKITAPCCVSGII